MQSEDPEVRSRMMVQEALVAAAQQKLLAEAMPKVEAMLEEKLLVSPCAEPGSEVWDLTGVTTTTPGEGVALSMLMRQRLEAKFSEPAVRMVRVRSGENSNDAVLFKADVRGQTQIVNARVGAEEEVTYDQLVTLVNEKIAQQAAAEKAQETTE